MRAAVGGSRLRLNHARVAEIAAAVDLRIAVQQFDVSPASGTPITYASLGIGVKLTATIT